MPGRTYSSTTSYRYGFNGQEKSSEIAEGLTTAMYWEYDSRIGRRWNVDPVLKVWESPYLCFNGNPILSSDANGDDANSGGKKKKSKGNKSEEKPNVTLDAGHNVKKLIKNKKTGKNSIGDDFGASSCQSDNSKLPNNPNLCGKGEVTEGDKAYELTSVVSFFLVLMNEFKVNLTRTEKFTDDAKRGGYGFEFRYGLSNSTNSVSFVSIHFNSSENINNPQPAFSVYEQGKSNQNESIKLGTIIVNSLDGLIPIDKSPAKSAKDYTYVKTVAVLRENKAKAATLIEFGNIKNEAFLKKLDANMLQIGYKVASGIHQYNLPDKNVPTMSNLITKFYTNLMFGTLFK
jgi:N-acetylmuramoyl-L-alanine amidase